MKRLILFIAILLPIFLVNLSWADNKKRIFDHEIPLEISNYYKDYNFVSSFSSISERNLLVSFSSHKELPYQLKTKRLERIYELMKKINAQIIEVDPEIILKPSANQYSVRPEVIEIKDVQYNDKEIAINVIVYNLNNETNLRFISLYNACEGNEEKIPSEAQRVQMAISRVTPRQEIHKWIFIDGRWMKREADIVLLKDRNVKENVRQVDTTESVSDAELDGLESKLKDDPIYQWKLLSGDRKKLISLILAAQKRKPTNPIWCNLINMCFAADQSDAKLLPAEERRARYAYAFGYLQEFYQALLPVLKTGVDKKTLQIWLDLLNKNIAIASLEVGYLDTAKRLAEEMLKNNIDVNSWNYGNVIHEANTILGRVVLRENNLSAAKMYLLESAKTPGSPQLKSWGPSFILARELLEKGEKAIVLEYLDLIGKFWANPENVDPSNYNSVHVAQEHVEKLSNWKKEIMKGNIPQDREWY